MESSTAIRLVAQHLSNEQRKSICQEFLDKILKSENSTETELHITILCDIVDLIPEELKEELYPEISRYCLQLLKHFGDENDLDIAHEVTTKWNNILKFSLKFDKISTDIIDFVVSQFYSYVRSNLILFKRPFVEKFFNELLLTKNDANEDQQQEINNFEILRLLKFLEWFFMANEKFSETYKNSKFDNLCYLFLALDDYKISNSSVKLLKWRSHLYNSKSDIWFVIFELMKSTKDDQISSGFVLWLRFFKFNSDLELLKKDSYFQDNLIKIFNYWLYLRNGLISMSHEHKKYSITLIQMSVKSLSSSFDIDIFKWDISKSEEYLESWRRFCTLYEILGIDTAMNQVEAATNDMISLLSLNSNIPVFFSLTILSVGFKASLESIRKFAMNLVFNLPKENLSMFKYDFKFLKDIFFPFALNASHFNCYKLMSGKYKCDFGDKLSTFVVNCITSLSNNHKDISNFVSMILVVLVDHKLSFDPARIYLSDGLLKGLQLTHSQFFQNKDLENLHTLFDSWAEGDVFNTTLHTINLKLLLFADSKTITISTFLTSLSKFIQFNQVSGFEIFNNNQEFFIDYININYSFDSLLEFFKSNSKKLDIETFTVCLSLIIENSKVSISSLTPYLLSYELIDELLVELPFSKLSFSDMILEPLIVSKYERLITKMITDENEDQESGELKLSAQIYEKSSNLIDSKDLFNDDFWISVNLDNLFNNISEKISNSSDEDELNLNISKIYFLRKCVAKCLYNENFENSEYITFNNLFSLCSTAFKNQVRSHGDKNFYKNKDKFYAGCLSIISALIKINPIGDDLTLQNKIFDISESLVTHSEFYCHSENVILLNNVIEGLSIGKKFNESHANIIVDILNSIWEALISDRLILNQKSLHINFIKLLMDPNILKASTNDEDLAGKLYYIANDIIDKSFGRKSLMPTLFKAISNYQVDYNESFEKTIWLSKLVVRGAFLQQINQHLFKLENIIADLYNKNLNMTGIDLYEASYGEEEIAYRVYITAIVASIKSSDFAKAIWSYIIEKDKELNFMIPKKRTDSNEQWRRLQLLTIMSIGLSKLNADDVVEFVDTIVIKKLFKEPSPLCRMYLEWMVAFCIYKIPSSKDRLFKRFELDIKNQQPVTLTIFERISYLIAQQLKSEDEAKFLEEFVIKTVIPSSTSNRALSRHFSVSLIFSIYPEIKNKTLNVPNVLLDVIEEIYQFAAGSDVFGSYRNGDALMWNITKDFNLVGLCGGVLLKISDREIDAIPQKVFETYLTEEQVSLLTIPIGVDEENEWIQKKRSAEVKVETFYTNYEEAENSSLLQTKSGAWSTVLEVDDEGRAAASIKRSPLIVVGSLVDKAPNLGGICRLCDVLGAGWLTLNDLSIKENMEFKSVAVTADRWMPMMEVKIEEITEFMRLKKKEGYTLIGLEQTDKSVELNSDLKFPEKSLILLGKEKEGIPGEFLAELDMCVIIKQVGVIRSMNIQTATAVIVHAYSSQHC
ncbi:hypothetical protein B5S29_g2049 [[Candida] boidinii]|nr:hypothetical protein B5S29_g2049 [[Candida] boidinii]